MAQRKIKVSLLQPNPNNPRTITQDQFKKLVKSIHTFAKMMELRPIVVDEQWMILGGNMRYQAIMELGYTEIPDTWVKMAMGLTEEEKQEFIVRDNVGFGEWDWEMLGNHFDMESLAEWGVEVPQMDGPPDEAGAGGGEKKLKYEIIFDDAQQYAEFMHLVERITDENATEMQSISSLLTEKLSAAMDL